MVRLVIFRKTVHRETNAQIKNLPLDLQEAEVEARASLAKTTRDHIHLTVQAASFNNYYIIIYRSSRGE